RDHRHGEQPRRPDLRGHSREQRHGVVDQERDDQQRRDENATRPLAMPGRNEDGTGFGHWGAPCLCGGDNAKASAAPLVPHSFSGPTICSGFTSASNSLPVSSLSSMADSRSVMPFLWAFLA